MVAGHPGVRGQSAVQHAARDLRHVSDHVTTQSPSSAENIVWEKVMRRRGATHYRAPVSSVHALSSKRSEFGMTIVCKLVFSKVYAVKRSSQQGAKEIRV